MHLGDGLFDERNPELLLLRLREDEVTILVTGKQVVHEHHRPHPVLTEANLRMGQPYVNEFIEVT